MWSNYVYCPLSHHFHNLPWFLSFLSPHSSLHSPSMFSRVAVAILLLLLQCEESEQGGFAECVYLSPIAMIVDECLADHVYLGLWTHFCISHRFLWWMPLISFLLTISREFHRSPISESSKTRPQQPHLLRSQLPSTTEKSLAGASELS